MTTSKDFEKDIENSLPILRAGGLLLYPTDTIWGIGCDATNPAAVQRSMRSSSGPKQKA